MTTKEKIKYFNDLFINKKGIDSQIDKLKEECLELAEAADIYKINKSSENFENMQSEMGDVANLLEQVSHYFKISDDLNKTRLQKLIDRWEKYKHE